MAERVLKEKRVKGKPGPYCGQCPYKDQPMLPNTTEVSSSIMLVGEGTRYSGLSGRRLERQLSRAGIRMSEVGKTNVVRCQVPKTRKPTKTAMRCCRPLLEETLAACGPQVVMTLGAEAFSAFYPGNLRDYHGARIRGEGYELIPMYKPDAFDDNPDLLRTINNDYKGLRTRKVLEPIDGEYRVGKARPRMGNDRYSVDTETDGLPLTSNLLGVSQTDTPGQATYTPARHYPKGVKFPDHVVMHNAKYDLGILQSNGVANVEDFEDVDDTMLLAYCMGRKPLGLKTLAVQEMGLEMKKFVDVSDDGKTLVGVPDAEVADYSGADADATLRLWNHLWPRACARERNLYEKIDKPLPPILARMQLEGVLVDVKYFTGLGNQMGKALADMERGLLSNFGLEADTLRSPAALSRWLAATLKHSIESTDHETLKALKKEHPVVEQIDAWRVLFKLKTSFVDSLLNLQKKGMIFPQFGQCGTRIGRFNSSDPNLQQTPKRMDKTIRKGFPARPGTVVCAIDNSQLDLRSLAWTSQDSKLMRIFPPYNADAHDEAAMEMFNKIDPDRRWLAKMCNFIVTYGGGPGALSRKTDLPEEQTTKFLNLYWDTHPELRGWVERVHRQAYDQGYLDDMYGRRCFFPALYTGDRHRGERQAQNFPPSGTSADVMKLQLAAASRMALPFATVHDELDFYLPEKEWRDMVPELVRAMQTVDCPFPLKCEASVGPTLGTMRKLDPATWQFKEEKKVERDAEMVARSKM